MSNTFNLSRDVFADAAFKNEPYTEREAFIWMVSQAAYKPYERNVSGHIVSLQHGQLCASLRYLAQAWQWHYSKVKRFIDRLKNRNMIETQSETGINVITLCNYSRYNFSGIKIETAKEQEPKHDRNSTETNIIKYNKINNSLSTAQEQQELENQETNIDLNWQSNSQAILQVPNVKNQIDKLNISQETAELIANKFVATAISRGKQFPTQRRWIAAFEAYCASWVSNERNKATGVSKNGKTNSGSGKSFAQRDGIAAEERIVRSIARWNSFDATNGLGGGDEDFRASPRSLDCGTDIAVHAALQTAEASGRYN